jgi:hypothetical protein
MANNIMAKIIESILVLCIYMLTKTCQTFIARKAFEEMEMG